ncbi:MAG TPA: hypothetical protein VFH23_10130 [Jiangellaceae bacterium]|nr:hypothetical protein [Jiangellaceae bacterium]
MVARRAAAGVRGAGGPVGVRGGEDVRSGTIVCAQWLGTTTFGHGSDEDGTAWE